MFKSFKLGFLITFSILFIFVLLNLIFFLLNKIGLILIENDYRILISFVFTFIFVISAGNTLIDETEKKEQQKNIPLTDFEIQEIQNQINEMLNPKPKIKYHDWDLER